MMLKLDRNRLAAEASMLDSILASMPQTDYLGRVGLEARREEVNTELTALRDATERRAKVALYFGGEPVIGSVGIQAGFGSKVVSSFQDLVSKLWGTVEGGEMQSMGPIRDRDAAQLHITHLVHGSFGFLLEEIDEQGEPLFESVLSKVTDRAAEYIANFAGENEATFTRALEEMHPRVFLSLRDFFQYIHQEKATFRLVEGERDQNFDRTAVERAWFRAEACNVDEERTQITGRLLGVIPVRRRFEFEPDGGAQIIEGRVGEKFSQTYLERIRTQGDEFAGRRWKALLQKRTVIKVGRMPTDHYTLLDLEEFGN